MSQIRLLRAFSQISSLTLLSRILGFSRDVCFAHFIGAGPAADAFLVAFKLPNLFRRLTAEGALTNAFLPVYSLAREKQGQNAALILAAEVQIALLLFLTVVVIGMEIFMPAIISVLAPGFSATPDRFDAAVSLARITMPYLPMISVVALWAALLNSADDFITGALPPVILNLMFIAAAFMIPFSQSQTGFSPALMAWPLAIALLCAGIAQIFLLQIRMARKSVRPGWCHWRLSAQGRAMWMGFVPAAIGAGATQINLLVDLILASMLDIGAISWLYYADRIAQLPLGLVGIALGTALLPRLSRLQAETTSDQQNALFAAELSSGVKPAAFLVLPATIALLVIAEPLIFGLFRTGAFSAQDAYAASAALRAYAIGLPAFVGLKVVQAGLYAMKQARLVMLVSLVTVVLNIVLSLILMRFLGHVGLALATGIVSWIGLLWLILWLVRAERLNASCLPVIGLSLLFSSVMGLVLFLVMPILQAHIAVPILKMLCLVGLGGALYLAFGWFSGLIRAIFFKNAP